MADDKKDYETLSEAMTDLKKRGFDFDFEFKDSCLFCSSIGEKYEPGDLKIVEIHRFEGMTSPDDSSILYAIVAKNGEKGLIVDAYGAYADEHKSAFLKDVEIIEE